MMSAQSYEEIGKPKGQDVSQSFDEDAFPDLDTKENVKQKCKLSWSKRYLSKMALHLFSILT